MYLIPSLVHDKTVSLDGATFPELLRVPIKKPGDKKLLRVFT